jgi:hypothetical protein
MGLGAQRSERQVECRALGQAPVAGLLQVAQVGPQRVDRRARVAALDAREDRAVLPGDPLVVEHLHEHGVRVRADEVHRFHRQLEHRVVGRPADRDVEVEVDRQDVVDRVGRGLHRLDRATDRDDVLLRADLRREPHASLLDPRACRIDLSERGVAGAEPERERLAQRGRQHVRVGVADERASRRAPRRLHELGGGEDLHRLADRPATDPVLLGELDLAGQPVAGHELAADDAAPDLVRDLLRGARRADRPGAEVGGALIDHAPIVRARRLVDRR